MIFCCEDLQSAPFSEKLRAAAEEHKAWLTFRPGPRSACLPFSRGWQTAPDHSLSRYTGEADWGNFFMFCTAAVL